MRRSRLSTIALVKNPTYLGNMCVANTRKKTKRRKTKPYTVHIKFESPSFNWEFHSKNLNVLKFCNFNWRLSHLIKLKLKKEKHFVAISFLWRKKTNSNRPACCRLRNSPCVLINNLLAIWSLEALGNFLYAFWIRLGQFDVHLLMAVNTIYW